MYTLLITVIFFIFFIKYCRSLSVRRKGKVAEKVKNKNNVVVPASRPNTERYEEYDFPKTRRLDEESYILGFVKLTM